MQRTDVNADNGNAQVFLIILVVVILAVGVLFFVNRGGTTPTTGSSASSSPVGNEAQSSTPNSVNETMTPDNKQTSNQDMDTQLSTLNKEGKDIDTSLNDQPVDVMAQ